MVLSGLHTAAAAGGATHPYRHGKAKPLAAIGLLVGAFGIAVASIRQILLPDPLQTGFAWIWDENLRNCGACRRGMLGTGSSTPPRLAL